MNKKRFFSKSSVIVVIVLCVIAVLSVIVFDPLNDQFITHKLEPNVSTLEGKLITRMYYGPPNYGENPETDDKEYPFILQLEEPIEIIGTHFGDKSITLEVSEVQLVAHGDETFQYLKTHKNETITVEGELFEAITGHHHTSVLLSINEIH